MKVRIKFVPYTPKWTIVSIWAAHADGLGASIEPVLTANRWDGKRAEFTVNDGWFVVAIDGEYRGRFENPRAAFLMGIGHAPTDDEYAEFVASLWDYTVATNTVALEQVAA